MGIRQLLSRLSLTKESQGNKGEYSSSRTGNACFSGEWEFDEHAYNKNGKTSAKGYRNEIGCRRLLHGTTGSESDICSAFC